MLAIVRDFDSLYVKKSDFGPTLLVFERVEDLELACPLLLQLSILDESTRAILVEELRSCRLSPPENWVAAQAERLKTQMAFTETQKAKYT